MNEVELINIYKTVIGTAAEPVICKGSDGKRYYTKFYEGVEGPRELVNEFIAYRLAKLLRLPIPNAALLNITKEFSAYIKGESVLINPGRFAFGSEEITNVMSIMNENFFRECSNQNDLLPIIIFDRIIANTDREYNYANMLYRYRDKVIFIIDHGRIFDVGTLWDHNTCYQRLDEDVRLELMNEDSLYFKIISSINIHKYIDNCEKRFESISYYDIKQIFDEIPECWECSIEDRVAGAKFLWKRFSEYKNIIKDILNLGR